MEEEKYKTENSLEYCFISFDQFLRPDTMYKAAFSFF